MIYKHCVRVARVGDKVERTDVPFGEIDGVRFGVEGEFRMHFGYKEASAMLIVNRWNYVATMNGRLDFSYYLPDAEGAN